MSVSEPTPSISPETPAVTLVTAELSEQMKKYLSTLQSVYVDHMGPGHLTLPNRDSLYATFAEIVVPHDNEQRESVEARMIAIRPRLVIAAQQAVNATGEPFFIPATYDHIAVVDNKVIVRPTDTDEAALIRRFFNTVLWSSFDRPMADEMGVAPVIFKRPEDIERADTLTRINITPHFRSIKSPITSLQIREFSYRTGKTVVTDEFSTSAS